MATLNAAQANYDDEIEEESARSALPKELGWHFRTWPNNLRKAIALSLGVFMLLIGTIYFLLELDKDLAQKLDTNTGMRAQAQNKLRDSDRERETIVKHLPVLRELEERGIYGEEKRLEWVEQLRIIEKRWPGISVRYDIAPQKILPKEGAQAATPPIPPGSKLPNGDPVKPFGVFSTDMKLTLQLLHEGDALAIFDELKTAKLGLFTVKRCTLKRNNGVDHSSLSDFGTPVNVECLLNWISMSTYSS